MPSTLYTLAEKQLITAYPDEEHFYENKIQAPLLPPALHQTRMNGQLKEISNSTCYFLAISEGKKKKKRKKEKRSTVSSLVLKD